MKNIILLLALAGGVLIADSSIAVSPALMAILPNKNSLTFEYTIKEGKPLSFNGDVIVAGSTIKNLSFESEPSRQNFVGVYAASQWIDGSRYGASLYQSSTGTHNVWNDAAAMSATKLYDVQFSYLSFMACKALSRQFFVGVALNAVKERAIKEVSYKPAYYAKLEGDDIAPTFTLSALYLPSANFGFFINGSTKANLRLKGNINAQTPGRDGSSSGRLDTIIPPEVTVGGFAQLSSEMALQFGVKKIFWSQRKVEDIQIDDATFEAYFGTPDTNRWHDVNVYFASLGYQATPSNSFQVGGLQYNGAHDSSSAYLTNASFGGKSVYASYSSKIMPDFTIGTTISKTFLNGGSIYNETLHGNMNGSVRNAIAISTKYQW
jgi:hypothetical protein